MSAPALLRIPSGSRASPARPRILTYADVRSERIDVSAQRALLRMSRIPGSSADAAGMADEVRLGRLGGIFKEDERVPALRAQRMGRGWWEIIPRDRDAVLFLDPDALSPETFGTRPPIIVFRSSVGSVPERLDPALRDAWAAYLFFRSGSAALCAPPRPGGLVRGRPSLSTPVAGIVPPVLCDLGPSAGRLPRCPVKTVSVWLNAFIPGRAPGFTKPVPGGPHAGKTMMDVGEVVRGRKVCFLTQGRDFSSNPNAPCMLQSRIDVDVDTLGHAQRHRRDRLVTLDCQSGRVLSDSAPGPVDQSSLSFGRVSRVGRRGMRTILSGEMRHPGHFRFVILVSLQIDIDVTDARDPPGQIVIVTVRGQVRNLPAYEIYASADGGEANAGLTLDPTGNLADQFARSASFAVLFPACEG